MSGRANVGRTNVGWTNAVRQKLRNRIIQMLPKPGIGSAVEKHCLELNLPKLVLAVSIKFVQIYIILIKYVLFKIKINK